MARLTCDMGHLVNSMGTHVYTEDIGRHPPAEKSGKEFKARIEGFDDDFHAIEIWFHAANIAEAFRALVKLCDKMEIDDVWITQLVEKGDTK